METRLTILLVDDNPAFCEVVTEFIKTESAVKLVGCAQSGAEAVELVDRLRPDVVLLDLEMPDMDGYVVASKIKAKPKPPAVVFVTGHDRREFREAAAGVQCDGFISKTKFASEFLSVITALRDRNSDLSP